VEEELCQAPAQRVGETEQHQMELLALRHRLTLAQVVVVAEMLHLELAARVS
jgi:hypothetical protein